MIDQSCSGARIGAGICTIVLNNATFVLGPISPLAPTMDIIDNTDHAMVVDEDETKQPLMFDQLYVTMQETHGLSHNIDLNTTMTFIQAACALKKAIVHKQLPTSDPLTPPLALPAAISHFLANLLGLSHDYITGLWSGLHSEALSGTMARVFGLLILFWVSYGSPPRGVRFVSISHMFSLSCRG